MFVLRSLRIKGICYIFRELSISFEWKRNSKSTELTSRRKYRGQIPTSIYLIPEKRTILFQFWFNSVLELFASKLLQTVLCRLVDL